MVYFISWLYHPLKQLYKMNRFRNIKRLCIFKITLVIIALCSIVILSLSGKPAYIPAQWRESDILHILKLLLHWQYFPLNSVPVHPYNSSVPLTSSLITELELKQIGKYNNFYLYKIENEKKSLPGLDSITELETFLNFQPMMSHSELKMIIYTFHIFLETCRKHNLTYFVIEGTLLGAYRHMGFIPWDDDLDVMMDSAQWEKIRNAFAGVKEITLLTKTRFQWKIVPNAVLNEDKSNSWPFLDIFFFSKDETHVWGITPSLKPHHLFKTEDIFPLKSYSFENLQVNVPHNMEKLVNSLYDSTKCVTGVFLHKKGRYAPEHFVKMVPCTYLHSLYPFVFRKIDSKSGQQIEELKIGSDVLKVIKN